MQRQDGRRSSEFRQPAGGLLHCGGRGRGWAVPGGLPGVRLFTGCAGGGPGGGGFLSPSALSSILEYCRSHPGTAAVLCTTGYSAQQTQEIQEAAKELPLFYSRNMSLGVNLLIELAKKAEAVLGDSFDVEIVEMHHNQKIDAPSGTALMIADAINQVREDSMQYVYDRHSQRKKREKKEIGLHSVRGGTIVGEHQVIFAGQSEVLTLSHSAQSKELFAAGAVNAAVFMAGKGPGLYDMSHLI
ncbi:MAG: 4-hydroxy-tetrahydrodipicolinate reductase [Acutalibacter sp.]